MIVRRGANTQPITKSRRFSDDVGVMVTANTCNNSANEQTISMVASLSVMDLVLINLYRKNATLFSLQPPLSMLSATAKDELRRVRRRLVRLAISSQPGEIRSDRRPISQIGSLGGPIRP